jgi:hypothetical protein
MSSLSRRDVSKWAGISLPQLDHFGSAGVAAADVGGERKRFSIDEARMVVIAGRCLKYGMTPRALVEPIDWLRKYVRWPAVEGIPKNLPEIEIELLAENLRHFSDDDLPLESKLKVVAHRLYSFSIGRHVYFPSYDDSKASNDAYQASLKSDIASERDRAEEATKRAEKMLAEPIKWTSQEQGQARAALQFELACRGERDMFFHLATGDDSWKTFVADKVNRIEGEATWLVIDIRTLFRERGALIA